MGALWGIWDLEKQISRFMQSKLAQATSKTKVFVVVCNFVKGGENNAARTALPAMIPVLCWIILICCFIEGLMEKVKFIRIFGIYGIIMRRS